MLDTSLYPTDSYQSPKTVIARCLASRSSEYNPSSDLVLIGSKYTDEATYGGSVTLFENSRMSESYEMVLRAELELNVEPADVSILCQQPEGLLIAIAVDAGVRIPL